VDASHSAPATVIESSDQITELLAGLVQRANSGETPASSPAET
jgi:hypothetical protein